MILRSILYLQSFSSPLNWSQITPQLTLTYTMWAYSWARLCVSTDTHRASKPCPHTLLTGCLTAAGTYPSCFPLCLLWVFITISVFQNGPVLQSNNQYIIEQIKIIIWKTPIYCIYLRTSKMTNIPAVHFNLCSINHDLHILYILADACY